MTSVRHLDEWSEVPELQAGDRLTRFEFHRRYLAMEHVKKAELIEGVVYMPSPVRADRHGEPHFLASNWLGAYVMATPGVVAVDNATVILDDDNEPQPDLSLRIERGQARLDDEGYICGAPELVVEISASSASYDLHDKKNAFRRNGVQEYVVWRVDDAQVDWFVRRDGRYEVLAPSLSGVLRSKCFPGLWLDVAALLERDIARVHAKVSEGVDTPEHADFRSSLGAEH